jgi:glycosyltransferase involved in cell wall biosynthesis
MLCICIPVYRYDVRPLVNELLRQAADLEETIEILVYDDASPSDGDRGKEALRKIPTIRYVELKENLGRAAIRNKMAREAGCEFLVMMDADGAPNKEFLSRWINEIRNIKNLRGGKHPQVVGVGGRHYQREPPRNAKLALHWWYGTTRESFPLTERARNGWLGFHSNNFLVSQRVLLDHPFPEAHAGYGHEDTLWGQQFVGSEVLIFHLDNPVVHLGLETNEVFLQKQKQAITNLRLLKSSHPHLRTRLIDLAERFPFLPTLASLIPEQWLTDYLRSSSKPHLYALDLLKLNWWYKSG